MSIHCFVGDIIVMLAMFAIFSVAVALTLNQLPTLEYSNPQTGFPEASTNQSSQTDSSTSISEATSNPSVMLLPKNSETPTPITTPLVFPTVNQSTQPQETLNQVSSDFPVSSSPSIFDFSVAYAYAGPVEDTSHSHFENMTVHPISLHPSMAILNLTYVSNPQQQACDVKAEVFLVQFSSDTNLTENYIFETGTCFNPSFDVNKALDFLRCSVIPQSESMINVPLVGRMDTFTESLTVNTSSFSARISNMGSFSSGGPETDGLWSNGQPKTVTLKVQRVGWVTLNGTEATTTVAANPDSVQVQLEKFSDGFLYNKIVPADEMNQIDPFDLTAIYTANLKVVSVDFGSLTEDQAAITKVTVKNCGSEDLTVESIMLICSGNILDTNNCALALPANATIDLPVKLTATKQDSSGGQVYYVVTVITKDGFTASSDPLPLFG